MLELHQSETCKIDDHCILHNIGHLPLESTPIYKQVCCLSQEKMCLSQAVVVSCMNVFYTLTFHVFSSDILAKMGLLYHLIDTCKVQGQILEE